MTGKCLDTKALHSTTVIGSPPLHHPHPTTTRIGLQYLIFSTSLVGSQAASGTGENEDIFSCLVSDCQVQLSSCDTVPEKQNLVLVCQQLLPRLLQGKFPSPVQEKIDSALSLCSKNASTDMEVLGATNLLKDILRPLRTCDPRFAYRYPDCKYNDKF